MFVQLFKGTGKLTKLMLRQQRFKIGIWLLSLIVITLAAASSYPNIYKDEQAKQAFALTMDNPAMVAMVGSGYELEDYLDTIGAIFAQEMLLFTAIAVVIMNILLVGKGTRGDEEDGRVEMVRSLSVGRLAYAGATMAVVVITNMILALFIAIGLSALRIEGIDAESSLLYGSILGVTGLIFGAFTAIFAQLSETSRGGTMLSFIVLIIAYLVRAIGDVSYETLSLTSPLGWTVRTGVFSENYWWPVVVSLAISSLFVFVALYLNAIRDLGSGFFAVRKGRRHATALLQTQFGLALRLCRTNIIAWAAGVFILGASFGAILGDLETYFADIDIMQAFIETESEYTMTEQFITLLMAIMSLISVIPAIMTVLRLKGEENKNRTENLYSRAISRTKALGSYYLLAVLVSLVMQCLVTLGLWSVSFTVMEEGLSFVTTLHSALAYLPAMWVIIGLGVLLVGAVPRVMGLVWLYVIYCFIVLYLGGILNFPEWMITLSVFEHVPQIPVEEMNVTVMFVLIIIAIILAMIGFLGYKGRDIS